LPELEHRIVMFPGCYIYLSVKDELHPVEKSAVRDVGIQFGWFSFCREREATQFLAGFNGSLAHLFYKQLNGHTGIALVEEQAMVITIGPERFSANRGGRR